MGPPLTDDIWTRMGISLLWEPDALASVCSPFRVISLRRFLTLYRAGWAEVYSVLVNEVTLVVAGLEGCLDSLSPAEAENWVERTFYPAEVSFQREVAGGGRGAALILWLAEPERVKYETAEDTHYWLCSGEHKGHRLTFSRCLFNGAQADLRWIEGGRAPNHPVGLYHPRIS
jgi:hypothetical protein